MARPRKFESPEQLQKLIDEYFAICDDRFRPYTIEGLSSHLEVDRVTLLNYEKLDGYEEFFSTIKKAKEKVLSKLVENGLTGDGNAAITIFCLKNNYGYKDKIEQEITGKDGKDIPIVNLIVQPIVGMENTNFPRSEDEVEL